MLCMLPILHMSGIFVRIKEIGGPRSISVPTDVLAKFVSLSQFWSHGVLYLIMVCLSIVFIYGFSCCLVFSKFYTIVL